MSTSTSPAEQPVVIHTAGKSTDFATQQTQYLQKSLGSFDVLLLILSAVLSIEIIAPSATFGAESLTWTLVIAIFFLVPYALIFAETGSAFIGEGADYLWVRDAFGRPAGSYFSIMSWLTQPVWVGGSMSFLAFTTVSTYITPIAAKSPADYIFKIIFIWITVLSAILALKKAKWISTIGGLLKLIFLGFFVLTSVLYIVEHGVALSHFDFSPTMHGFAGVLPLVLFAYLGFESSNNASGEMHDPQHSIPRALITSGFIAAACYLLPVFAMLVALPADKINSAAGLLDAVGILFSVYGPAQHIMLDVAAGVFTLILLSQGAAWMVVSDRMQALSAADGSFFGGFFGVFHRTLGTPVHVNLMSGTVATCFMLAAMLLTGTSGTLFSVVLNIAISTFLLSYLLKLPAAIKLRWMHPDVERPFRFKVNNAVFTLAGALCVAWIALGAWITLFPGTLSDAFGIPYDFVKTWGTTRGPFEALTFGTLVVIAILCAIGYRRGARVRAGRYGVAPAGTSGTGTN